MGRDRAAYMREYRARRRDADGRPTECVRCIHCEARIAELVDEVAWLKRELAARASEPQDLTKGGIRPFNTRPFTPVPKKGK